MKILVVGSGGREHALVWALARSPRVKKIYCAPGNAGIGEIAECVLISSDDIKELLAWAAGQSIDLVVVGPEAPLAFGIVDLCQKQGLKVFGPCAAAARLEASKAFAKELMREAGVPTAEFEICQTLAQAESAIQRFGAPVVVKADGLAAGKGVVVASSQQEARDAARAMIEEGAFGSAGKTVVVERCLQGEEASILVLTDGEHVVPLASAQDHKRVFDGDQGPNTGGMGAYSPAPVVTEKIFEQVIATVIKPVLAALKGRGVRYRGVLYAGIMMTPSGPSVLEFNVRFGDPETQAILPRLESDLFEALQWTTQENSAPIDLKWSPQAAVSVVLASGGYPGAYEKARKITGLDEFRFASDIVVFHAGTKRRDEATVITDGGRVLAVTGLGSTLRHAQERAYAAVSKIHFDRMHYRRDIAWRAVN